LTIFHGSIFSGDLQPTEKNFQVILKSEKVENRWPNQLTPADKAENLKKHDQPELTRLPLGRGESRDRCTLWRGPRSSCEQSRKVL